MKILNLAHQDALFKDRSLDTAKRHLETVRDKGHQVRVCLLGDSMLERFSTTGQWESLEQFPSAAMLPQSDMDDINRRADANAAPCGRMRGVANFGCGGDKIENVLFRLIGDESRGLAGLAETLYPDGPEGPRGGPKLWVIHAGTNNLKPKKGLLGGSLRAMRLLLEILYRLASPGTRFLLTGLFYREDIPDDKVDEANKQLKDLVIELQNEFAQERPLSPEQHSDSDNVFEFLAPELDRETTVSLRDDHVHLNLGGYRTWMKKLHPKVEQMLSHPKSRSESPKDQKSKTSVHGIVEGRSFSKSDPPNEVPRSPQ